MKRILPVKCFNCKTEEKAFIDPADEDYEHICVNCLDAGIGSLKPSEIEIIKQIIKERKNAGNKNKKTLDPNVQGFIR